MNNHQRLQALRDVMARQGLDAFLVPTQDSYLSEYPPAWEKRLHWLTGFGGSAGTGAVLEKQAALFTDGRYTLQAAAQLDPADYQVFNSAATPLAEWLAAQLDDGSRIGIDLRLFSTQQMERMHEVFTRQKLKIRPLEENPIDGLWRDRPPVTLTPVTVQELRYAGEPHREKRARVLAAMKRNGAEALLVTAPDSIAWLLNIRAADLPHVPVALSTLLLQASEEPEGRLHWFIDAARLGPEVREHLGAQVTVTDPDALSDMLEGVAMQARPLLYDPALTPHAFIALLKREEAVLVRGDDPCQLMKACKNDHEVQGARQAHRRDGVSLTRFLHEVATREDLDQETEYTLGERLDALRFLDNGCLDTSFDAIIGFQSNGAIVHYRAQEETARPLRGDGLLLVDSGGQYREGTTDVTRTLVIGKASEDQKRAYTAVLKGHIALATARFPEGTAGSQLDALARAPLWCEGLDYDHGTGHGVGSYLSVHEGPQRISKAGGTVALRAGMILSNEPGYYRTGEFGIRLENLVVVQPVEDGADGRKFFGFETLTLAPFERRLILKDRLSDADITWLNAYHQRVYAELADHLPGDVKAWLKKVCAAL